MKKYRIENRLWIMDEMISELEDILIQTIQTVHRPDYQHLVSPKTNVKTWNTDAYPGHPGK